MFSSIKRWDNRGRPVRLDPKTGRSWTRRITWMEDNDGQIKLKMEDGSVYKEVMADRVAATTIWDRFKAGQSIDDAVSILGNQVPKAMQSKKAQCHCPNDVCPTHGTLDRAELRKGRRVRN